MWRILSSILNLGNVEFDDSSYVDGQKPCSVVKNVYFDKVIKLLKIDASIFEESLVFKQVKVGSQVIKSPLTINQCRNVRDSFARQLYNNLFNWIVKVLNMILLPKNLNSAQSRTIGMLDIFGFEIFEKNSFEQFMINFANEKLQGLYIEYIFKNEKKIFIDEGLEKYTGLIKYTDNKDLLKALDFNKMPLGIFNLIDNTCKLNKDDKKLFNDIMKTHKKTAEIKLPRFVDKLNFTVVHTANDVEYYCDE